MFRGFLIGTAWGGMVSSLVVLVLLLWSAGPGAQGDRVAMPRLPAPEETPIADDAPAERRDAAADPADPDRPMAPAAPVLVAPSVEPDDAMAAAAPTPSAPVAPTLTGPAAPRPPRVDEVAAPPSPALSDGPVLPQVSQAATPPGDMGGTSAEPLPSLAPRAPVLPDDLARAPGLSAPDTAASGDAPLLVAGLEQANPDWPEIGGLSRPAISDESADLSQAHAARPELAQSLPPPQFGDIAAFETPGEVLRASAGDPGLSLDALPAARAPDTARRREAIPRAPRRQTGPAAAALAADRAVLPGRAAPRFVPQLGADDAAPAGEDTGDETASGPALVAHAASFDDDETRPLLSVVLVHDPADPVPADQLAGLPLPVSFAVDPGLEDAAQVAAAYRDAGFEVLILGGALPRVGFDAALEASLADLPETVAILDTPDNRLQGDRAALSATLDRIGRTGHGLVTYPRGLNSAAQAARRADIPAETLFRQIDGEGDGPELVARVLDRAAFAAGQEGAVVVTGTTRAETLAALIAWALGERSENVALAPVSAVLTRR